MASGKYCNLVVFLFCLFSILAVAKSQGASASASASGSGTLPYEAEINGGEIGIKMDYSSVFDTRMSVVIFYDTEVAPATDFFQKQLTADLFQKVNDCGVVNWYFMPCGTSKLNNGALTCPISPDQCKFDRFHACVTTLSKKDEIAVGKFVICFFNSNKDVNKCIGDAGLGQMQDAINQCADKDGANLCNEFNGLIHSPLPQSPGSEPPVSLSASSNSAGSASTDGTSDFKKVLCQNLAVAKLECGVCAP